MNPLARVFAIGVVVLAVVGVVAIGRMLLGSVASDGPSLEIPVQVAAVGGGQDQPSGQPQPAGGLRLTPEEVVMWTPAGLIVPQHVS